jgi:uncharacterized membrane protein YgdD (TMEM256/DUF423 family)
MTQLESRAGGLSAPAARWGTVGAASALIAVMAGAFGAHALRGRVPSDMLEVLETGARYQMFHALALIAAAWALDRAPSRPVAASAWCFALGTVFFSGSLYGLALTGIHGFGFATPLGGLAFMVGWVLLAVGLWRARRG